MASICLLLVVTLRFVNGLDDWLIHKIDVPSRMEKIGPDTIRLTNSLIHRDFCLFPDFFTLDFYSAERQQSILRAVGPEAQINIDGIFYNVGGIWSGTQRAYLNRTDLFNNMTVDENAFHYVGHSIEEPKVRFHYKPRRGAPDNIKWPPAGIRLDVHFEAPYWAPEYHQQLKVTVHYEIYDGMPLLSKWVSISGPPELGSLVDVFATSVDSLAVNYQWAPAGYGWMHVETDLPHTDVTWYTEPTQSDLPGSFQQSYNATYPQTGLVALGDGFETFRVHLLVVGSSDPERYGLSIRRKLRLLAPQTQENPIYFHMTQSDQVAVRRVIDQLVDVGFEMMLYSFGSGFDLESWNATYLEEMFDIISYANGKGIEVGGYDLIALTRSVREEWMSVGGDGACFASGWYDYLLDRSLNFIEFTGLSVIEPDGPYGGYACSSTNHSHHKGHSDSVYTQLKLQTEMFRIWREKEVYINQPDQYFYYGGSKTGMGYNENQYSLPRWQDLSISRQGMYDDTFHYIPSIGWMFLPIIPYHGGGDAAMFEPLSQHLVEYEWGLAQYLGAGVAACYRGYQIYDGDASRALVQKWVSFYKKYRRVLNADIIHVRRADMQGIDGFMHALPRDFAGKEDTVRGLAMLFNPTDSRIRMNITLPLYYTGLETDALVKWEGQEPGDRVKLDRRYNIEVDVDLQALGVTWYTIE